MSREQVHDSFRVFLNDRMRVVDREVTRRANDAVARSGVQGLSNAHGRLMSEMQPGGTRPSRLAERLGVTKAAVGQLLVRLQDKGMVERAADPADGRALIVRPTRRAQAAYRSARQAINEIEGEWRDLLGADDLAALERCLVRLEEWANSTGSEST